MNWLDATTDVLSLHDTRRTTIGWPEAAAIPCLRKRFPRERMPGRKRELAFRTRLSAPSTHRRHRSSSKGTAAPCSDRGLSPGVNKQLLGPEPREPQREMAAAWIGITWRRQARGCLCQRCFLPPTTKTEDRQSTRHSGSHSAAREFWERCCWNSNSPRRRRLNSENQRCAPAPNRFSKRLSSGAALRRSCPGEQREGESYYAKLRPSAAKDGDRPSFRTPGRSCPGKKSDEFRVSAENSKREKKTGYWPASCVRMLRRLDDVMAAVLPAATQIGPPLLAFSSARIE